MQEEAAARRRRPRVYYPLILLSIAWHLSKCLTTKCLEYRPFELCGLRSLRTELGMLLKLNRSKKEKNEKRARAEVWTDYLTSLQTNIRSREPP